MKKKIMIGVSYAAVAALAVGGTMAYFTSTGNDTNVFTVGNVKIEQHEYQRADGVDHINPGAVEGDLVPFEQGKTLIPAVPANDLSSDYSAEMNDLFNWGYYTDGVGGNGLWNDDKISNVMDKFVFVENTGKTDAYYRTVIAFECPEGMKYGQGPSDGSEFMMNINGNDRFSWTEEGYTEIDGTRYLLMTATYNEVLTPGEISRPSLLQIVMTHNATSEDAELIGDTYEVLVASQAVQADDKTTAAEMLDKAFGKITTESHPWVDENIKIDDEDVVPVGEKFAGYSPATEGEVIDGMVIVDETATKNLRALYKNGMTGDLTITNSYFSGQYAMNVTAKEDADAVLSATNTAFYGWTSFSGFDAADFTDCVFGEGTVDINTGEAYNYVRAYDDTVFTNCEFKGTIFDTYDPYNKVVAGSVKFVNCTYNGVPLTEEMLDEIVEDGYDETVNEAVRASFSVE